MVWYVGMVEIAPAVSWYTTVYIRGDTVAEGMGVWYGMRVWEAGGSRSAWPRVWYVYSGMGGVSYPPEGMGYGMVWGYVPGRADVCRPYGIPRVSSIHTGILVYIPYDTHTGTIGGAIEKIQNHRVLITSSPPQRSGSSMPRRWPRPRTTSEDVLPTRTRRM